MALPYDITSITVPDTVMFDETAVISWSESENAEKYRLYARGDTDKEYKEIYSGSGTEFAFNAAKYPNYGKIRFRVCGENSEGISHPCESTEMSVVDVQIKELEGEIPIDTKYSYRLFDISGFMKDEFKSLSDREEYIRRMSAHINRSVRKLRYLIYRDKIFGVKVASAPEFTRRPAYCNLDIAFKCYEVFGYGKEEKVLYGDGTCTVSGDTPCYPVIILEGEKNNPVIKVNNVDYQIAIDTSEGDTVIIDCENETVLLEASDGSQSYLAGAFYLDFPVFNAGENTVQGCDCVRWRDKWFIM